MADFIVTTLQDENDSGATVGSPGGTGLSLREAIALANANPDADTITFAAGLAGGTLTLTQGELGLTSDMTIDGDVNGDDKADITISGNDASRIFDLTGSNTDVVLSSLDITNGSASGGGAIRASSAGSLTIDTSTIRDSAASVDGGGLSVSGTSFTLTSSLITGNTAGDDGGGLSTDTDLSGTTATITNTTITGNAAGTGTGNAGGGVFNFDGLLIVENSTISGNTAGISGGVATVGDAVTRTDVSSTIIAGNTATQAGFGNDVGTNITANGTNSFTSLGDNLIGDGQFNGTAFFTNGTSGDIVGTTATPINPLLGALADNGGPVQTLALQAGSQAINNGNRDPSLVTDARGAARDDGNGTDIGAFELQSVPSTPQSFVVTTLDDELDSTAADATIALMGGAGDLSLREAIFLANLNGATNDTITFAAGLAGGTLTLDQGELVLTSDMTIDGDVTGDDKADITISGNDASRIFRLTGGTTDVVLNSLDITNGYTTNSGGAIYAISAGSLTIDTSTVRDSEADFFGGGLYVSGTSFTLTSSLITRNTAGDGGGGLGTFTDLSGITATITNTTITGNAAGNGSFNGGGGVYNVNGLLVIENSTISGNRAGVSGGVGTFGDPATRTDVSSSIIAGNTATAVGYGNDVGTQATFDSDNSFNSLGDNLIGDGAFNGTAFFTNGVGGDIVGTTATPIDPLLGALADNGGPVQTLALQAGSQAIDAGNNDQNLTGDARGAARNDGNGTDIGAFELQTETESVLNLVVATLDDELDSTAADASIALMGGAGDLSLREAIFLTNLNGATNDTIAFDPGLAGGTLTLTQGELALTSDMTIDGDVNGDDKADITISGNDASRVFNVTGAGTDIVLSSLDITNGSASGGGAIYADNSSSLTIDTSTIRDSAAAGDGGGLYVRNTSFSLTSSLITGNTAGDDGGGLFTETNLSGTTATITNTTITGNAAGSGGNNAGGGIYNYIGLLVIENSTISGNTAGISGGVASYGDVSTRTDVSSTIIAGNTATAVGFGNDVGTNATANATNSFTSLGDNLIGDGQFNGTAFFTNGTNGDIVGTTATAINPLLGALADNGGPVRTLALQAGSQAINNGNRDPSLVTDARGAARDDGNGTDIGAFELQTETESVLNLVVTTLDDELDSTAADATIALMGGAGDLSLREAIFLANLNGATNDTITFAAGLASGTLTLTQGQLSLTSDMTIDGDVNGDDKADITISGNDASRIFQVTGSNTDVVLNSLDITNGSASNDGGAINASFAGSLTIDTSTIRDSAAGFDGGGLYVAGTSFTLTSSLITGNTAGDDGGGLNTNTDLSGTTATITNTTITGNAAGLGSTNTGGGIRNVDGLLVLQNSTISGNTAGISGGVGTLGFANARTDVSSTIIAGNTATAVGFGNDVGTNSTGNATNSFTSLGDNLIGDGQFNGTAFFTNGTNGDIVGTTATPIDPLLGALADNGGPVQTLALLQGSQAIDTGNNDQLLATDARGSLRTSGLGTDIGAFERASTGSNASDILLGTGEADAIDGLSGEDTISGFGGSDVLNGGANNDIIHGDDGKDTIDGGSGNDTLNGDGGTDTIIGGGGIDTISGGSGADNLSGGVGNDTIHGGGGGDTINGGAEKDVLNGDGGNDTINGGQGTDVINGGIGRDIINGGSGADVINAGSDKDQISGSSGSDTINGGQGTDVLNGDGGNDVIDGGSSADIINGGGGRDTLSGGSGGDTITGGARADTLTGNGGADHFRFVDVTDSLIGDSDVITDFTVGVDKIDLSDLIPGTFDVEILGGFTGNSPSVRTFENGAGNTVVRVDVDGDGGGDMRFDLLGTTGVTESDFVI